MAAGAAAGAGLSAPPGAAPWRTALRLSEIIEHDAPHLAVTNRKQLLAFYDALKTALKEGRLTPEGGALPTSLNELLALLPGEQPPAKRDRDLANWSVENDPRYAAFLDAWRTSTAAPARAYKPRAIAAPLHSAVTRLQEVRRGEARRRTSRGRSTLSSTSTRCRSTR